MPLGKQARAFGAIVALSLALGSAGAEAAERPSFDVPGSIYPAYDADVRDYTVRGCDGDAGLQLAIAGAAGWRTAVDGAKPRRGDYTVPIGADAGEAITVSAARTNGESTRVYSMRCLPEDFPTYEFAREREGGPKLFSMQLGEHYGAIFDGNGVPVWWIRAKGEPNNLGVLPDGTITLSPVDEITMQVGDLEVRTLRNKLLQRFPGGDIHDLVQLPNGNYLIGRQDFYREDLTGYGLGADARVIGIVLEEVTPAGKVVWTWASRDHLGPEETGSRWWGSQFVSDEPYDFLHWNAIEKDGKGLLVSFRHADSIFKIDRKTGTVVWKLGGRETAKSLEVRGDPLGEFPLGGQHDVRLDPDGNLTVLDNRTLLENRVPRALSYRIDEKRGTARLVDSLSDPEVQFTICCGSVTHYANGEWLVGWGGNPLAGAAAYDARGRRIYHLNLDVGFTYRAKSVPKGALRLRQLRSAMDAMAR